LQTAAQYQAASHLHVPAAHHHEHVQHEIAMKHAEAARTHGDMGHKLTVVAAGDPPAANSGKAGE